MHQAWQRYCSGGCDTPLGGSVLPERKPLDLCGCFDVWRTAMYQDDGRTDVGMAHFLVSVALPLVPVEPAVPAGLRVVG
eukprot:1040416-Alexandrium_andersonii.AAC.1